jgi:hypothetical protein
LARSFGELTALTKSMTSFGISSSSLRKLILPITEGPSFEPSNKGRRRKLKDRRNMLWFKGPTLGQNGLTSQLPSPKETFSKDYPHNDALVISCVIKVFLCIMS